MPDLVIEIVSPNDRWSIVQQKIEADLNAGVRAVWIIDPHTPSLAIHAAGAPPRVLHEQDVLDAGDVIDGFELLVGDLFAAL